MERSKRDPDRIFTYETTDAALDPTNLLILRELSRNPRITMAEIGRRVSMSAPAVAERVRRLEEAGVIRGYRLELNPSALGLPLTAFVRVKPKAGRLADIPKVVDRIPEVAECHRVTGEDCFVLKVYLPSMDQLDRLLDHLLLYGTTTTSIVQSSPVPSREPPLPTVVD